MVLLLHIVATFFMNSYEDVIRRGYLMELKKSLVHCAFVTIGDRVDVRNTGFRYVFKTGYLRVISGQCWCDVVRKTRMETSDPKTDQ